MQGLDRMAGSDVAYVEEPKEVVFLRVAFDGIEDERVVVPRGEALGYRSDEPTAAALQYRNATERRAPFAPREFVDVVARLPAEELRKSPCIGGNDLDAEQVRVAGHTKGVVQTREEDGEADRLDAALAREADETSGTPTPMGSRDNEHRRVELVAEPRLKRRVRAHEQTSKR
jgi:hypothetical protein